MVPEVRKNLLKEYQNLAETELMNVLNWWKTYAYLPQTDTYAGLVDADNKADPSAALHCVLTARYLWGFSAASRFTKDPFWLEQAGKIFAMYEKLFKDPVYGGAYWEVLPDGTVLDDHKQMYGNAFWIYGLSEYALAGGPAEALEEAKGIFNLMMKHTWDYQYGGIIEGVRRDWTYDQVIPLSTGIPASAKSMNTSLHVLEAMTNLLRVWKDPKIKEATIGMLNVFLDHITDPQGYFRLYQDWDFTPFPDEVSYGHDIEGSWLLWEAAEVIGEKVLLEKARPYCLALCRRPYEYGLDAQGGMTCEGEHDGTPKNTHRIWWVQAETSVGLLNHYQMTGKEEYLDASFTSWKYILKYFADHEKGEWFDQVSGDGIPKKENPKCNGWKAPYHNVRACMEVARRCKELLES